MLPSWSTHTPHPLLAFVVGLLDVIPGVLVMTAPGLLAPCVFFQGEDGRRDIGVTGVQTCALPISPSTSRSAGRPPSRLWPNSRRCIAGMEDRKSVVEGKSVDLGGRRNIKKKTVSLKKKKNRKKKKKTTEKRKKYTKNTK